MKKFEELIAWQKARLLAAAIYAMTSSPAFNRDYGLRDQIRRACVGIMSNIAEGFEREGAAEFNRFLVMAKASCAEVRSHLYIALDIGYISREKFDSIHCQSEGVARIIGGLRSSLKRKRKKLLWRADFFVFNLTQHSVLRTQHFLLLTFPNMLEQCMTLIHV